MKYYEQQIEKFANQIKEIEASPDPTVFRSRKLFIELTKERWEAELDSWRQGGIPTIEGMSSIFRFYKSMGFRPYAFPQVADHSTQYADYKKVLERMWFPEKTCERVSSLIAMSEIGDLPKPDMLQCDCHGCDLDKYYPRFLGDWFKIPVFFIDVPLDPTDKPNLDNLNYIVDQLGEFIEFVEKKFPGIKYNKDKHIEMLEMDAMGEKYRLEVFQMLKHVPCPISPAEGIAKGPQYLEPSLYPNMKKAVEYCRMYRDELGERVASGRGSYGEERLRLMWAGHTHEKQVLNPVKVMIERKVALPLTIGGGTARALGLRTKPMGEMSEYGVKLSPLQEEARIFDSRYWGGPGKRWVEGSLQAAREIGAHGIIHFNLIGCTPMRSVGTIVAERAEKDLGIPVLNLEGRVMDKEYMSQEAFDEILSPFIDKCFDWAKKPRQ